jgi:hypothetical protein
MAAATPIRIDLDELGSHIAVLESELSQGHSVELVRGGSLVGEVYAKSSPLREIAERPPMPDFMARLKETWGDHVFPEGYMTAIVREDRDGRG